MSTDQRADIDLAGIDLYDPDGYVAGPPHETFALLRRERPVVWKWLGRKLSAWCPNSAS